MNKTRLLHIGFPKCMSTTLQRDLFAAHQEIMFLGWGHPDFEHGWISDEMATLCEVGIRYEKVLNYQKRKAKKTFEKYLAEFEQDPSKKAVCLSFESFSFTMHFDVDPTIKADRLRHLLGKDTKVLIVIRNQLELIRSYYFECVRGGYAGAFDTFLDFNYHYQFHSIFSDLAYSKLYRHYCKLFGKENVMLLPMETIITGQQESIESICKFAGVSNGDFKLGRHNDSSDLRNLQAIRYQNSKFPNNRGQSYFGWVDDEKLRTYWHQTLGLGKIPEAASRNYSTKMMVLRSAEDTVRDFVDELDADYSDSWIERISDLYRDDNEKLAKLSGLDLPGLNYIV